MSKRALMSILWPSFIMAGVMSAVVFAFVDPLELSLHGAQLTSRQPVYTLCFFLFWALFALCSSASVWLATRLAKVYDPVDLDRF
ncbi:MAG TPA: hypothetical protein H9906_02420 [Candidatus Paenalcaligenes intestinipullorum]|uniref:Transmembrane protein n=1 Tax=Candidatus Paenalcaligenes intestinipullorum TaxID=2838718 RepID=A0A9D2RGB0_9BURK|nr:hypothetical protein [Candidatus Paenalcaligenes intestinipullorum]